MAMYTIELRDVVALGYNIFDFPYDCISPEMKEKLQRDFIRHFYFREIGCETIDRFKLNLEDKFVTVFPYYNELFKANQIEYAILDNYKLTETITRKQENRGQATGISSTVGKTLTEQQTDTTGNVTDTGNSKQSETGSSETSSKGDSETNTTRNATVEGENSKTGKTTTDNGQTVDDKYIDTPQGLTDLSNSKYLTNYRKTETAGDTETNSTETRTDKQTTTETGNSKTVSNDSSKGSDRRNTTEERTSEQNSKGSETMSGEQRTASDNNTRSETSGSQAETIVTERVGNIGVDTDSDVIQKHIKLQAILKKIELMFFDECEDLFMGVY